MDHFSSEHWVQFVQGFGAPELREEIESHLLGACANCGSTLRLWNLVLQAGKREAAYSPGDGEVERAKRLFSTPAKGNSFSLRQVMAMLVFNSAMQPSLAGVRGGNPESSQQLLYEADPFTVAIQFRPVVGNAPSFLAGQVLSSVEADVTDRRIDVALMSGDVQLDRTTAGSEGEFAFEVRERSPLSLRIEPAGYGVIWAELPGQPDTQR